MRPAGKAQAFFKSKKQEQQTTLHQSNGALQEFGSGIEFVASSAGGGKRGEERCQNQKDSRPAKEHFAKIDESGIRLERIDQQLIQNRKLKHHGHHSEDPVDVSELLRSGENERNEANGVGSNAEA